MSNTKIFVNENLTNYNHQLAFNWRKLIFQLVGLLKGGYEKISRECLATLIYNVNEFQLLRTALKGFLLKVLLIVLSNDGNDLPING